MVAKTVKKKVVAKPIAAKPVATIALVAKPAAATPVTAKVETPKPVVAAPAAAKVEAPKPVVTAPVGARVVKPPVAAAAPAVVAPTPIKTPEPAVAKAIVAPIIAEGKTIMNDTVTKVQETAQKFTTDATARASEMFGDVSARAKTAMEKGSKGLEEMVEFSKGNLEAVVASGRVAAKGAQDIAKYSAEYGRKSIEDANATAKKFAAVKSPTEFFALQSEVAKTSARRVRW